MRKSLQDIIHMVRNVPYPKDLPDELKPYNYYVIDGGHSIMCVLEKHLKEIENIDMDMHEVAVPVKYVLEKGYRFVDGYVVVEAPYDQSFGLEVEEGYYEY